MTTYQILALVGLVVAVAATYGSSLMSLVPKAKPAHKTLAHIEAIVRVRDAYPEPDVTAACNALLATLLKVKA